MNPTLVPLTLLATALLATAEGPGPQPLQLTSPREFQVFQRTHRSHGPLTLAGSLQRPSPDPAKVEFRLPQSPSHAEWSALAALPAGETQFQATITAPAGGWYPVEIRVIQGSHVLATTRREHVGVGEVFVVAGQSNSANHGEERQKTRTGRVATYAGPEWRLADDPQPGASGTGGSFLPPFGDALVDRFDVPIGLVACGVGATSVREWLPRGTRFPHPPTLTGHVSELPSSEWESRGVLFDAFTQRLRTLGAHGFRAVLWHQGESDANQSDPIRTLPGDLYQTFLRQLIRESTQAIGWNPPWFVALASYHTPDDPGSPDLRAAQRALWTSGDALEGPDSDALTGDLRDGGGKGVHFSGKGLREHAARWVDKVAPWLERQ